MFKAIIYKEWLKIRWCYIGMAAVTLFVLFYLHLKLTHDLKFSEATSYWYFVIFRGVKFYLQFKYIPFLAGLVVAFTQFIPEINMKRLKLTLHLPMRENKILVQMMSVGVVSLLLLFLVAILVLSIITLNFFPIEMLGSVLLTTFPWFLAGLVAYFAVSMIILEPLWIRRILLILISYGFINSLFKSYWYNLYTDSLPIFILLGLFFCTSILLSAHRFRKGVM